MAIRPELISLRQNSSQVAFQVALPDGQSLCFRPLAPADAALLGGYFTGLSTATQDLYRPHEFTHAVAEDLCSRIEHDPTLRMVAVTQDRAPAEIAGYFLLNCEIADSDVQRYAGYGLALNERTDCRFAPSVADRYQNTGLGSLLMPPCLAVAQRLGYQRLILLGGVYMTNARAVRFYTKNGFRQVGAFSLRGHGPDSFDMILTLNEPGP